MSVIKRYNGSVWELIGGGSGGMTTPVVATATVDIATTANGGTTTFTGLPFAPTSVIAAYVVQDTNAHGVMMRSSAGVSNGFATTTTVNKYYVDPNIEAYTSGGSLLGTSFTFGSNSLTITWTKSGSPTGTLHIVATFFA